MSHITVTDEGIRPMAQSSKDPPVPQLLTDTKLCVCSVLGAAFQ